MVIVICQCLNVQKQTLAVFAVIPKQHMFPGARIQS